MHIQEQIENRSSTEQSVKTGESKRLGSMKLEERQLSKSQLALLKHEDKESPAITAMKRESEDVRLVTWRGKMSPVGLKVGGMVIGEVLNERLLISEDDIDMGLVETVEQFGGDLHDRHKAIVYLFGVKAA